MTGSLLKQPTMRRAILATIILLALCGSALAGTNVWSGNGPFAPASGHRAVHALAIAPDGSVIYSGLDTGTVMSLTFDSVPTVTNVAPPTGPVGGGTFVNVTGSHFTGVLGVKFDDTDATSYTVVSSTEINATAPAGSAAGPVHVRVITPSGISAATTSDVFTYTGPATRLFVSTPSTATAGSPFTCTVTALDSLGRTSTDYIGQVHFSSSDSAPALPADYTFASTDAGSHTFTAGATLNTPGTQTISANDTGTDTINGQSIPITVSPGPVTQFAVSALSPVTSGTSFSVSVTSLDEQGNTNSTYDGTVHFTSTDGAAVLPVNSHLTSGHGSFSTILNTTPSQTISATDTVTSSITGNTGPITVNPGPAARFTVVADTPVTAGTALPTLTVTALDAAGNTDASYAGTIHFTSSDTLANLPSDYLFTAGDAGIHTFLSEATLRTAGTQTITATDTASSFTSGASNTITVVPAAVDHFTVAAPAAATADTPVTFTVTARDAFENTVTGYGGMVQFASTDSAATLPGSSALTNGAGTFSTTFGTAGTQTVTATDTVTSSLTGTSGNILVSATTRFSVAAPAAATSGTAFTFTVNALDGSNNPVAGYPGTVHFTSTDPAATLPADTTLTGGTGTFTVVLRTPGSRTITATDTGSPLINGTSGSIAVSAVPAPTPSPSSGGSSSSGTSGSGGSDDDYWGTSSDFPLMTVTVNIGGDSKAWQAVVTGTKLSDLIVTGTVQPGSGSNMTSPPGIVYQYISLVPARYNTITKAVIYFTIPQAWLDENHIDPKSIVLYHQTANGGWEALPTTVVSTKDGTVYFSAQANSFSIFAIAGTPGAPAATITTTQDVQERIVQTPGPAAVAKAPVTTQTTAPPATAPQPAAPSPILNIVLVIAAIGVLAGGGFLVRRWWIQRQNPALFRKYD